MRGIRVHEIHSYFTRGILFFFLLAEMHWPQTASLRVLGGSELMDLLAFSLMAARGALPGGEQVNWT